MFKSLRIYQITTADGVTAESLAEQLSANALPPCGRLEPKATGWVSPYGRDKEGLVHSVGNCHLVRYGIDEKVLPTSVIRGALTERVSEAEGRLGRPPGRREKLRMKDEVMMDLLPRAFVKPRDIDADLELEAGWLVVDCASSKLADEVASLLRMNVPAIRLNAADISNRICTYLTQWLKTGECPGDLHLGEEVDLRDERDESATIRCRRQDLESREIRQHVSTGMQAFRMGLRWGDRLAFTLSDEFTLLRVKALDYLVSQLSDIATESDVEELDAEFAMTSLEFRALLEELSGIFNWPEA